jgi:hypothetical protein
MQVHGATPNPNLNTQQTHRSEAKPQSAGGVQFNEFIKDIVKQDVKKVSDNDKADSANIHDNKEWLEREGGYKKEEDHVEDLLKEIDKVIKKHQEKK